MGFSNFLVAVYKCAYVTIIIHAIRHDRVTKQRAKNEGGRAKPKRYVAAGTWAGTVAIIYRVYGIWSTAKATVPEAAPLRTTARKSRVLPSGNWEDVTVCYLTAKTQSSGAYVCLYCWPVVAFSGRIILPLKQWVPYTKFSREVNDCLLSIMRASRSTITRKYTDIYWSCDIISWKWESACNFM